MDRLTVTLKTVTPMFLGGAEPDKIAELRAPSIKGALRFWYRAMYGNLSIEELRRKEAELFGSADKDVGQSKLHVTVNGRIADDCLSFENLPRHSVRVRNTSVDANILTYLCYAIYDNKTKKLTRPYVKPDTELSFQLRWGTQLKEDDRNNIMTALNLLQSFGGLGARNRNGFGSFTIIKNPSVSALNCSHSTDLLRPYIKNGMADYTALSNKTKLFKTKEPLDTWHDALSAIGTAYMKSREKIEGKYQYEKRRCIAAPIIQDVKSLERHAKPYFLHVNPVEINGVTKYIGIVLFLPYNYCSAHPKITDHENKLDAYNKATHELNTALLSNGLEEVDLYG
jgi:CRISPR-associated protein Cmr1